MPRTWLVFALLLATAIPAAAQQQHMLAMAPMAADTTREAAGPAATTTPTRHVLPAIVARAELGGFQVVEIPVPEPLRAPVPVRWAVDPLGEAGILSRRSGDLAPGDSLGPGRRTSLLVTFAVPRRARAGLLPVANVRFVGPNGDLTEVPVHLLIDAARNVEITVAEALRGVRPGEQFTLRFRLTNLGNTPETVEIRTELPPLWRSALQGDRFTELPVHGMAERVLSVTVPPASATGSATVRLIVLAAGVPVATAEARIEVQPEMRPLSAGPVASITTGIGYGADGTTASGATVELRGRLTPDISVSARLSHTDAADRGGSYALARAGIYQTRPMVQLTASTWSLGLGLTGESFTDLTGIGLGGEGISARARRGRVGVRAMAGRPVGRLHERPGTLAGGQFLVDAGPVILSATATHLSEDRAGVVRQLGAIGFGAEFPEVMRGVLATELAQRWTDGGDAPGAALSYQRQTEGSQILFRATHAPGGSRAFARATDELSVTLSRSLTPRAAVHGAFWHSRDDGSTTFTRLHSRNASGGASYRIATGASVAAAVLYTEFGAEGPASGFGNEERFGALTFTVARGALRARSTAQFGEATRTTRIAGAAPLVEQGARRRMDGALTMRTTRGEVELSGRLDASDLESGAIPLQTEIALRVREVPLLTVNRHRLVLGAGVRRSDWPGFAAARWTTELSAEAELPLGLTMGINAERNPFLRASGGGAWLYGLRLRRSVGLPRLSSGGVGGVVFQDRNGNGRRDAGEPGLGNVVVRHRNGTTVTDRAGRYRFAEVVAGAIEVDPASLAIGMIVMPGLQTGPSGDIGVVALAPVHVELHTAADPATGRDDRIDLARVTVMARHESGRLWIARKVRPDLALFDALPPGRYEVVLDLLDLAEPVEMQGGTPVFEVTGAAQREPIRVTLQPRPITIRQLEPSPRTGAAQGQGQTRSQR